MTHARTPLFVLAGAALCHACWSPPFGAEGDEPVGRTAAPLVFASQATLMPISAQFSLVFGRAVDVSGSTLVVSDDLEGLAAMEGAVYVYEQVSGIWTPDVKLEMPVESQDNRFGHDVAIDGDTIAAGAWGVGLDEGAVVVFVNAGGWTFQEQLVAPDAGADDRLGVAVALDGDTIVAGAPRDDDAASNAGAAYVFVRSGTTWAFEDKLVAPDGAGSDLAGSAVALDGDTAVVGAYDRHGMGGTLPDSGGAYVYQRTGSVWAAPQLLEAPTPTANAELGAAVAIDADTIVVGEPEYAAGAGRAHVFVRQGGVWAWQATLEPPVSNSTYVGSSVAVHGDRVLLGAWNDFNGGSTFVFERAGTTWSLAGTLKEPNGAPQNAFGHDVAIDGGRMAISAFDGDVAGADLGSAYAFAVAGEPCGDAATCPTGLCVDGVCCTTACDEGCGRCDAPGNEGTCWPLGAGTPAGPACPGFVCQNGTDCPTPCTSPQHCAPGFYCDDGGDCLPVGDDGAPCTVDAACASAHCADGVCCDSACEASCEACAESGSVGTCVVVTGAPRSGHPACPADSCANGVLSSGYTCDGSASDCVADETPCEPYACGDGACRQSCLSDAECADDFNCLVSEQICLPGEPICDGVDVLTLPDGGSEACRPYRCTESGTCRSACAFTGDCSPGFVCGSDGRCVAPPAPRSPASCALVGGSERAPGGWWLLALALAARRRLSNVNDTHRRIARTRA